MTFKRELWGKDGKETKNRRRRWWMDVERRNIWRRIDNDM